MVELIKGFVINFELLILNVNLIVSTTFLINGHGLNLTTYKARSYIYIYLCARLAEK